MTAYIGEFIGTAILLILGAGVVANVSLTKTLANGNTPWLLITTGWGLAVFVAVYITGQWSGAHLNPAVTLSLALTEKMAWSLVPGYIIAQILGAMTGSALIYLHYRPHFDVTEDEATIKGCFCTGPAIPNTFQNLFSEVFGTFILVFAIFYLSGPKLEVNGISSDQFGLGSLDALPVGLLVWVIGISLGGTTGYAINPARDFGPRIVYALLRGRKGNPNWSYAWIPIVGPMIGAALASGAYLLLEKMN